MSELLDNQIDTQNENLKIKIPGFMQALVEVVTKKQLPHKKFLMKGGLYKAVTEDWRD